METVGTTFGTSHTSLRRRPFSPFSFSLSVLILSTQLLGVVAVHAPDAPETLQQEVDISPAGIERRKALLRTERGAGFPDWRELDVDATGVLHESLAEQVPQVAQFGVDPMQDAINSIISDLLPYKQELERLNASNKTDPQAEKAKKRQEKLQREAHCWKECKGCHFKEAQAVEECFVTLEEAKVACAAADCSGISTQSKVCNGTWTLNLGSSETVEVPDSIEMMTLNMQTLSVDRECLNNVQNANASKYVISLNNKSWVNAEKACADEGLQLATPRTKEEMKALNVAMMQKNVQKVHIGLRRDVQFGQGPWTDPSVFYWVDGETLDAEWPGWGGYGSAEGVFEIPVKQPHWEAFLDGCCYVGYFETVDQDGTKGVGDTTCNFFRIPFACQPDRKSVV